jgi:hypothetical protein
LKLLLEPQYNLTQFVIKYVVEQPLWGPRRKKLFLLLSEVGQYLPAIHKLGNFDYQLILGEACKLRQLDTESLQFLFGITREFELLSELLVEDIKKNVRLVRGRMGEEGGRRAGEEITAEEYMSRGFKDKKVNPITHCRYFVQMGKLYRKYTMELVSLYKINRVLLNFEKSTKKSGFKVVLKSYDEEGRVVI